MYLQLSTYHGFVNIPGQPAVRCPWDNHCMWVRIATAGNPRLITSGGCRYLVSSTKLKPKKYFQTVIWDSAKIWETSTWYLKRSVWDHRPEAPLANHRLRTCCDGLPDRSDRHRLIPHWHPSALYIFKTNEQNHETYKKAGDHKGKQLDQWNKHTQQERKSPPCCCKMLWSQQVNTAGKSAAHLDSQTHEGVACSCCLPIDWP